MVAPQANKQLHALCYQHLTKMRMTEVLRQTEYAYPEPDCGVRYSPCLSKIPIYVRRWNLCFFVVLSTDAPFSCHTGCHSAFDLSLARRSYFGEAGSPAPNWCSSARCKNAPKVNSCRDRELIQPMTNEVRLCLLKPPSGDFPFVCNIVTIGPR